ncbi:MAG: hypothetical protein HYZ51_03115 [Candidatus Doudnabacteria bacterium]|nr:hypothetical protein [Candidatus Doudnabacteria bacterium]
MPLGARYARKKVKQIVFDFCMTFGSVVPVQFSNEIGNGPLLPKEHRINAGVGSDRNKEIFEMIFKKRIFADEYVRN